MDNDDIKEKYISTFFRLLLRAFESLIDKNGAILASGLVYSSLVALVPLITFIVVIMQNFGLLGYFTSFMVDFINSTLGEEMSGDIISTISSFTQNGIGLGIFGFVSFICTTILLVNKIYTVINFIFSSEPRSSTIKRFITFFTFIIFAILMLAIVLTLNSKLLSFFASLEGSVKSSSFISEALNSIYHFLLITLVLFLLFKYVPNAKVRALIAFSGAIFGSILLTFVTFAFKYVVSFSVSQSILYGSLSTIFFLLLYLYICWFVFLIAAEFTYVLQFRPKREQRDGKSQTPHNFLKDILNTLSYICASYKDGRGEVSRKELLRKLLITPSLLDSYLNILLENSYILETRDSYVPAKPLDQIRLEELIKVVYGYKENSSVESVGDLISEDLIINAARSFSSLTIENLLERL